MSSSNHSIARSVLNGQENRIACLELVVPTFATQEKLDKLRSQYNRTALNQSVLKQRITNEEEQLIRVQHNITALNEAIGLNENRIQDNHEETKRNVTNVLSAIEMLSLLSIEQDKISIQNHSRLVSSIALANLKREGSAIALTNSLDVLNASLKEQIIEEHNFSVTHFQNVENTISNVEKTALNARRVLKLETSKNISALGIQVHANKAITDAQHETTLLNHTKVRTELLALSSKSSANHLENIQNHTTTMLKLQIHQSELDSSSALLLSINESLTNQLIATDALTTGKFSIMTAQLEHEQYTRIHATNNIQEFILGNITAVTETANQDRIDVSAAVHLILC